MESDNPKSSGLKEKALEEFKIFWIIVLYLAILLGSFTVYRRLILKEFGFTYLHYGFALIEAMIIAKVILVGHAFGMARRFERGPLILSVLYKSALFAAFVFLFGILEHVIDGLFHKKDWVGIMNGLTDIGVYEIFARMLMLIVAFVPFFAFWEMGRVFGWRRLTSLFFSPQNDAQRLRAEAD